MLQVKGGTDRTFNGGIKCQRYARIVAMHQTNQLSVESGSGIISKRYRMSIYITKGSKSYTLP